MIIHLYSLCKNEEKMLPYFFRHYDQLIAQYFLFDNHSTDRSVEIIQANPKAHVQAITLAGDSFVQEETYLYNHIWKQSRGVADWVVIMNLDEHIYVDDIPAYLRECMDLGITVIPLRGFEMVCEEFPDTDKRLCDVIKRGVPWSQMDKVLLFNPNKVEEINFGLGRHDCTPSGVAIYPVKRDLKLLHYKYLGFEYLRDRHLFLRDGLKDKDVENKWGHKYLWSDDERRSDFDRVMSNAIQVIP